MFIRISQYTSFVTILFLSFVISCNQKPTESRSSVDENETANHGTLDAKIILFFGNSLTAGYGLEPEESFVGIIQQKIDSSGLRYKVINGGLSGETTASGVNRLDWFLEEEPSVFVLELGGNDGLRGIPVAETRKNLQQIIRMVQEKYPSTHILLAGMQIPPNMGQTYSQEFSTVFPDLAQKQKVTLIPFLLEGVAGDPDLNLPDGIHPSAEGHIIVAETIWGYLKPILQD